MTRTMKIQISVAFLLGVWTAPATAQVNPLVPETPAPDKLGTLRRVIQEGCSPLTINEAMRTAAFTNLADWLEREGKPQEARRIRAISEAEKREFAKNEASVVEILTGSIGPIDKGGRWDAERNLATATALLGGVDGLIRYVAAARNVQLELYKRPSSYLYQTRGLDLATWVRQGAPGTAMTALPSDMRYTGLRAAFEIPFNLNRYLLQGTSFGPTFTPSDAVAVAVNAGALEAVDQLRTIQARSLSDNPAVPLRQTLAQKMAEKPDTAVQPGDASDVALTYAAWLPNLCIGYQQMTSPLFFSQRTVSEIYINSLKTSGAW